MSDVFISYSRKNSDFARKLIEKIKAIGKDWWVDWEGIPLSSPSWWAEIKAGIENADNFVFIMSPDSMASVVCNMELDYAIALGKRIIPVVYQDVQTRDSFASIADFMPDPAMEERLAGRDPLVIARDNWQRLSHINWTFFRDTDNFDEAFEKLSQAIKRDLPYVKAHTRYLNRANEWVRENKRADLLLFGGEIDVAEEWLIKANKYTESAKADEKEGVSNPILQPVQQEYISISRKAQNLRRFVATAGTLVGLMALVFAIGASLVGVTAINNANIAITREFVANEQSTSAFNNVITATFAQGEALVNAQQAQEQADNANNQLATATFAQGEVLATATQILATGTAVVQNLADAEATLEVVNTQVFYAQATVTQAAVVQNIIVSFANIVLQNRYNPELQIAQMNELVIHYPNEFYAYYSRALVYSEAGRQEEAIADYNEAIQINPHEAITYYNRGNAYANLEKYEEAIADYNEAIRLNPICSACIYNNRGHAYANLEKYEEAIADFNEAIRLNPNYPEAYNNRGHAYGNLDLHEQAIVNFNEAIRLNPDYTEAYYNRGLAYGHLGENEQALINFDKAIQLNSEDAKVYYDRGVVYLNLASETFDLILQVQYLRNVVLDLRMAESLGYELPQDAQDLIAQIESDIGPVTPTPTPAP